jgi:hypothetical protein
MHIAFNSSFVNMQWRPFAELSEDELAYLKKKNAENIIKMKLCKRMIKQLLNSVLAKYRYLSVPRGPISDLLATSKSRHFAQPRPIIDN